MKTRDAFVGTLLLAALAAAAPARALTVPAVTDSWAWGEPQEVEKFSKTVPLGKTGSVIVTNIAGDIVVTGGAGDQVVIDAVKRGRTVEDLKAVQIEVIAAEGRVEVATRYPKWNRDEHRHSNSSVSYTVTIPRGAMLRVKSISGDVRVSTVDGELRAETVSGDVEVSQAGALDAAKSVSGSVTVKGAASAGTLGAGSVSGDVSLWNVKARAIEGSTVSGDVTLNDVVCDRVAGKSVSGTIRFSGPLASSGRYALQSHSGDVWVKVPATAGFEVSASSFSGDINSDLPLTVRFGGTDEGRGPKRQAVRGTYGDGSATLELTSFSGNVRIVSAGGAGAKK
jgi:hypothetical protein